MATNMLGHTIWAANSHIDLSGSINCFAAFDATTNDMTLPSAGGVVAGVITEANVQNAPSTAQLDGIGKVILAAALNANALVQSDVNGNAVAHTSGYAAGILLTGGQIGDVVSVKLF